MVEKQTKKIAAGVGLAAAAAALAAGAYWLYGAENAQSNRKKVKGWMLKARGEVMDAIEKMEEIDKEKYLALVKKVVDKYSNVSGVTALELAQVTKDLRSAWTHIELARSSATKATKRLPAKAKKAKRKTPAKS